MRLRFPLLFLLWRQMLPATLIAAPVACAYVLWNPNVMHWRNLLPPTFIFVHALGLHFLLGTTARSDVAFLFTRGFSRNALYSHRLLAEVLAVTAAWAPAAGLVWTGLRAGMQDALLNPFFPVMAPKETMLPLVWLLEYGLIVAALEYRAIRLAQPGKGGRTLIVPQVIMAALAVIVTGFHAPWFLRLTVAAALLVIAMMVAAGRRLHRRMEVRG